MPSTDPEAAEAAADPEAAETVKAPDLQRLLEIDPYLKEYEKEINRRYCADEGYRDPQAPRAPRPLNPQQLDPLFAAAAVTTVVNSCF